MIGPAPRARARAQGPKAQGPGAPYRALGQGPGAPYRALGPCALGTWARARAQSSIHPSIHLYIYEPMGHVRNHRIYFLIWGWGDKECRIFCSLSGNWHTRKLLFITRNPLGRYTPMHGTRIGTASVLTRLFLRFSYRVCILVVVTTHQPLVHTKLLRSGGQPCSFLWIVGAPSTASRWVWEVAASCTPTQ